MLAGPRRRSSEGHVLGRLVELNSKSGFAVASGQGDKRSETRTTSAGALGTLPRPPTSHFIILPN